MLDAEPAVAAAVDPDAVALLMFSSGTTGEPRAIALSHSQCVANAHQVALWGHLDRDDRVLAVLPLPEDVVAHCREHMVPYKVPAEVVFRAELPMSPVGKVLRRPLRDELGV